MATAENRPTDVPAAKVIAPPKKKRSMRAYVILLGLAATVVAIYFIHGYLTRNEVATDDAQVDADVVPVSTRVSGVILHMKVTDNQKVEAGAVIAEIDDAEYQAKVEVAQADFEAATYQAEMADAQVDIVKSTSGGALSSAKAQLQGTGASVRSASAQVDAAQAQVAKAKSDLATAQSELERNKKLHDAGAISGQALDTAQHARDSAQAQVDTATANLASARDQQSLSVARVGEAQGRLVQSTPVERQITSAVAAAKLAHARAKSAGDALALAKLALGYTKITAPVAGYVSRLGAHEGQMLQAGMTVVMVVPAKTYVIANFKETQMERIRPGDEVDISIDALGGSTLHGKVDSISAGTGARFSMMPPDNATGNFVKVVQRVPVKIAWDAGQDLGQLHAGLSVEVVVHLAH